MELAETFEARTGIEVEQVLEGTTKVFARLRAEKHHPRADVWYGGGGMIPFITATREGLLESYRLAGWEDMPRTRGNLVLRDPEFRWVGMAVLALGDAYNPRVLRPPGAPYRGRAGRSSLPRPHREVGPRRQRHRHAPPGRRPPAFHPPAPG